MSKQKKKKPVGRPRGSSVIASTADRQRLADKAREYADEIVESAVSIMRDSDSDAARMSAINFLADRGWGRPVQSVEFDPDKPLNIKHNFEEFAKVLNAAVEK